jgi:hypothetical protein
MTQPPVPIGPPSRDAAPSPSGPDSSDEALAAALQASRVMHDAPEALVQRALDLWAAAPQAVPRAASPAPQPGLQAGLRRLMATLAFDSLGLQPQAAGMRSAAPSALRQLLYTAEGRDIDLRIAPAEDGLHWVISGQVLGPEQHGSAALRPTDTQATGQELAWNELAEFHFAPVPAGPCTLVLSSAGWTLELPLPLPPGAPPPA